jgi:predicted glycosyltransferase
MGGYKSLVEAVFFGKRPVVVPRLSENEEQTLRARGFARLGLANVVEPTAIRPETLWQAIETELQRPGLDRPDLPFDGLNQIARELVHLLPVPALPAENAPLPAHRERGQEGEGSS